MEIEGLKEELREVRGLLDRIVEDMEMRLLKKEQGKMKSREKSRSSKRRLKVDEGILKRIVEESEKIGGKRGMRGKLGCILMYLTGMRIGSLRGLTKEWFKENIIKEGDDIEYCPNKQRGKGEGTITIGVSKENKE